MQNNYFPATTWQGITPATMSLDTKKLLGLETTLKSEYSNINGIIVVRNGYIVFEKYFNGFGPMDPHHITSVTKSILSALIGIAINKGYIESTDQKVLDFFPEYIPTTDNPQKHEVTLRHLLTMTAPYSFEDWHEPFDKLCASQDWIKYTLDMLGENGSIGAFKYSSAGAHLLSAILTRSTGKAAREFANEHLFAPIGMKTIPAYEMKAFGYDDLFGKKLKGWAHDPAGNSTGGWGLKLAPQDMARFGLLYLNNGTWNNNQIIPEEWIKASIALNSNKYGYLWWLFKEKDVFAYAAMGDGGNIICCIPEKNMVVAIASEFMMNPRDRWTLIKEHIIPTVKE
jgi:CubicO group peptidase (beta-lactamase class C family)